MAAFKAAVEVGSHAIETDLHLSKDGVVMLSHDATLRRCFGEDKKLADCDWEYLSTLKTTREPQQPIARLFELLQYVGLPENVSIWLLLDIKLDDDPDDLLIRTAKTIALVPTTRAWKDRIVLGAWDQHYIDLSKKYFPGFAVAHIGFLPPAFKFLKQPNLDFNILQPTLVGPCGKLFMKALRKRGRKLYVWTVNDEHWMKWSIRKQVNGVITDDPKLFLEVCDRWSLGGGGEGKTSNTERKGTSMARKLRLYTMAFLWQVFAFMLLPLMLFMPMIRRRKKKVQMRVEA
ncbi:PLC-like phosphodiesterase [Apodospora peruviana]|uniref:PLC-like phosphodiesterase n=1 Tax=Apodospora peruviana TaxID=516989 RepID=A0AAE0IK80_9PEZI|nr:PLC-like phosphodiesterase [Apodospora peruviana]